MLRFVRGPQVSPTAVTCGWLVRLGWAAGLGLALSLSYRVSFDASFYLDTVGNLVEKANLRMTELSWRSVNDAIRLDFGQRIDRPLARLSLALTHLGWGLEPAPYRLGNLAVHFAATLSLAFLFQAALAAPRVRARSPDRSSGMDLRLALVGAALWSLHPLQTNVVTYVIQRMTGLAGLFTFLGMACYLKARSGASCRPRLWGAAALAAFALGLLSKQTVLCALLLVPLAEAVLLEQPREARRRFAAVALAALAAAALVSAARWAHYRDLFAGYYAQRPFTLGERLLTEARIQADYLLRLVIPDPRLLVLDAEIPISRGLFRPPATAALLAALLGSVAFAVRRARSHPLLSFGILWYLAAQAVEATVIPLELYFEHRLYVPSAFLFLGAAALAETWVDRRGWRAAAASALVVATLSTEAWGTFERNRLWTRPLAFYADNAAKAPGKSRVRGTFGMLLEKAGRYDEAEQELKAAIALDPASEVNYLNLATLACDRGHLKDARAILGRYFAVATANPWQGHHLLALIEERSGRRWEAIRQLSFVLRLKPENPAALTLLGRLLLERGDRRAGIAILRRALRFDPGNEAARRLLTGAEARKGPPLGG